MREVKHQDALRTIGEVATDVGVATHVLRFWESKFNQINPQKRRGRRYYGAKDIAIIKTIKELLYEHGYTIKGVHKFLNSVKKEQANLKSSIDAEDNADNNNVPQNQAANDIAAKPVAKEVAAPKAVAAKLEQTNNDEKPEIASPNLQKLNQIYNDLCAARDKLDKSA